LLPIFGEKIGALVKPNNYHFFGDFRQFSAKKIGALMKPSAMIIFWPKRSILARIAGVIGHDWIVDTFVHFPVAIAYTEN
jgi:hypothetical protein